MSEESKRFRSQFEGYPPELTAKYEVLECLSATENGQTLLVQERGTNAYRIAKVAADGAFEAERQALGALSHPGLPQLLEWIPEGSILVRSFVEGKPLDQALAERPLREDEVVEIGVQLCDVLHYLHNQSPPVIHRDVKPQNVILGPDGKVTLIDFGIARTYKENASKDTAFSGTSDFAPPEQYGFAQTDARADIYALGIPNPKSTRTTCLIFMGIATIRWEIGTEVFGFDSLPQPRPVPLPARMQAWLWCMAMSPRM